MPQQQTIDFYNTVRMSGDELISANAKAKDQKQKVLAFMKSHSGKWTAYEIWDAMGQSMLITSVRRCLTDLFHAGYIQHNSYKVERYGIKNKQYHL